MDRIVDFPLPEGPDMTINSFSEQMKLRLVNKVISSFPILKLLTASEILITGEELVSIVSSPTF